MPISKSVHGVITLPNFPCMNIKINHPEPEELKDEAEYYIIEGVVPVMIEIWEKLPNDMEANSDLTDYWVWLAYFPGLNLNNSIGSDFKAGIIEISSNGVFGVIDGGENIDINDMNLQVEILKFCTLFDLEFGQRKKKSSATRRNR